MGQRFKRETLAAVAVVGLAGISVAAEPLILKPSGKTEIATESRDADGEAKKDLVALGLLIAGCAAVYSIVCKGWKI